jgi:hypothetical protein
VVLARGLGVTDVTTGAAVTADTPFDIASVSACADPGLTLRHVMSMQANGTPGTILLALLAALAPAEPAAAR